MAQPGNFTPLLIYGSSTPTNVPLATNLTNNSIGSEIAINVADKNLFFKDSGGVVNTVPIRQSGTSSNGWLSATDWNTFNNKGSGTVTSVTGTSPIVSSGGTTPAISLATAYGDTLNPYASKTANYILAAPNGSAGVPTFRALVAADLPSLSGTYIPYTGASSAIDLNAQTVTNIAHLGLNSTAVPDILLRAYGDNNSTSRIAIRGYSSNANSSSIRVAKFRGTFASPQAPLSGDSLGKFELAGYGTTSSSGYPQASYEGVATENWGATARGTKALFYVTPNTTITQAVALTIDQDKSATFASTVTATSFSGSGSSLTGVVTSVTGTSPVVSSGGTTPAISMPAATTSVSGYLTSTDWNTFNNKGSGTVTSVSGTTGRITSTGGTTPVIDLASGVATAGTTGSSTLIPVVTIDTYGRVTSITTASNPQGTVTSVTGTAPVVSSGGATPAISMAAATGSVNGYLTSTDWTTFNNKGSGTVTSVTGTAPVVSSGGATPAISMAAATTSVNGYLTSTDWTTFNGKQAALVSGTNIKTVNGTSLLGSGDVGTIGVAYGGTGLTSLTAGYIPYGNGTSAFNSSANMVFDGSTLTTLNSSYTGTLTGGTGVVNLGSGQFYKDASGNVGIGTAPAAWSGFKALQLNSLTNFWNNGAAGGASYYSNNLYYNGSNRIYQTTGFASEYTMGGGIHAWYTASSGTAGGTVTLKESMRIHASGGVSIGNTTDSGAGTLNLSGTLQMPANVAINFAAASQFYYNSSTLGIQYTGNSGANTLLVANNGVITMNAYGVGTATFSASGVISSISDETYKIKDGVIADPFPMLMAIETGYYFGKPEANMGSGRQLGFYAQNIHAAIGEEAAPTPETYIEKDKNGEEITKSKPWGYYDRSVLAVVVEALKKDHLLLQELKLEFDAYKASHL